jgi:hypothetical protein
VLIGTPCEDIITRSSIMVVEMILDFQLDISSVRSVESIAYATPYLIIQPPISFHQFICALA